MTVKINALPGEASLNRYQVLARNSSFVLGLLAGALAANLLTAKPAGRRRPKVVAELAEELKLDQDQRALIEQILVEARRRYVDNSPQFDKEPRRRLQLLEIRQATRVRVRALLRPEQAALFDRWLQERDARRK